MLEYNNFAKRFANNKRAYYSAIFLAILFFTTIFAEFIANDKPILIKYKSQYFFPIFQNINETTFGGELLTTADYLDPQVQKLIKQDGWMIFPFIHFSFDTINMNLRGRAPSSPTLENLFGTDDQARDVLARIIYGIRISLLFGGILSILTLIIGIFLGAIQGYFGGKIDLFLQRFIEIWSSLPVMYLLIIFSAIIVPSFWTLLLIMLAFSWVSVVSYVRAEFLRLRNFDFVKAHKVLGASSWRTIFLQILPNATPIIIANLPFLIAGSITTITALDFLGLGLPVGSPSLGELLAQGKNNINSYWLGLSGFFITTIILALLVFIAEGLRDGFDSKK
jgi:microcin C transport system permease protein